MNAASRRAAMRAAIKNHPGWPAYRAEHCAGRDLSTLNMSEIRAAVLALDLDTAVEDAPDAPCAPIASDSDSDSDPVAAAVANVLSGPLATLPDRVAVLARRTVDAEHAASAASIAAMPAGTRPAPLCLGESLASDVFRTPAVTGVNVVRYRDPAAPAIDPHYDFDGEILADVLVAVSRNRHVWLGGPKGSGKSSLVEQIAARLGRGFVRIGFHLDTTADYLIGSTGITDGETVFEPGILVHGLRTPGTVILLDEITGARGATLIALHELLDGGGLSLPDGTHCKPATDVILIAADNTFGAGDPSGLYVGTALMNSALIDRFAASIPVGYLPAAREARMIAARSGLPHAAAALLVSAANHTRDAARDGSLGEGIGPRRLIALAEYLAAGRSIDRSLEITIYSRQREDEAETLRQVINAHLDHAALTGAINGQLVVRTPETHNSDAPEFAPVTN